MRRTRAAVTKEVAGSRASLSHVSSQTQNHEPANLPAMLRQVDEDQLSQMEPGDAIVLDRAPELRRHAADIFHAVIACPLCGLAGLITPQQYFGAIPVICPSDRCSCRFRIREQSVLIYLPVN
jgi:hypothetical protein